MSSANPVHFFSNGSTRSYTSPSVLLRPQLPLADRMLLFQDDVRSFELYYGVRGSQEAIDACEKLLAAAVSSLPETPELLFNIFRVCLDFIGHPPRHTGPRFRHDLFHIRSPRHAFLHRCAFRISARPALS